MSMKLQWLELSLAVCKLDDTPLPAWAQSSELLNFTRTPDECSLVCEERLVPEGIKAEKGWRALKVDAVLDFSLVGILAGISSVLAQAGVSIYAVSTYDTDYILLKQEQCAAAKEALQQAGYEWT